MTSETYISKRLTPRELVSIEPRELLANRHKSAVLIVRTSIKDLGIDVLNLFPPTGKVFWSFGFFRSFREAQEIIVRRIRANILAYLNRELTSAGLPRPSINNYEFFSAISRAEGTTYYPYSDTSSSIPYWWFAQRHVCCICPIDQYRDYLGYFVNQRRQIGHSCFANADDDESFVDIQQYKDSSSYVFLTKYAPSFDEDERVNMQRFLSVEKFGNIDLNVARIVGCRMGVNLGLLDDVESCKDTKFVRALLLARAHWILQYSTLLDVETTSDLLMASSWLGKQERNLLMKEYRTLLDDYPIIGWKPSS